MSITVDPSAALETETQTGSTMTVSETPMSSDSSRVQLRPVGFPSPVTQLFDYILAAWDFQKGDHCTYKYVPSRESHMEMTASVLIRLPNKQSLLVKDTKFRASRVLAQNAVAQLALEKLALEDSDLKAKMEALAEEMELSRLNSELAPPPPPPNHRYASNPGYPSWRSRSHHYSPHQGYYDYHQAGAAAYYPPPPFGMYPAPMSYARSSSAPNEENVVEHHPEMYYFSGGPVLESSNSNLTDTPAAPTVAADAAVMTPTGGNWQGYYPYQAPGWPYYPAPYEMAAPYEMNYYPVPEDVVAPNDSSSSKCH